MTLRGIRFEGEAARRLQETHGEIPVQIRQAMERIGAAGEGMLAASAPVGRGTFRDSIAHEVRTGGTRISVAIGSPAAHAPFVEAGRKPGKMPPVAAIQAWVTPVLGLSGAEARGVAFVIARAIGRRGTKASHVFQKTRDRMRPEVRRILREAGGRLVR